MGWHTPAGTTDKTAKGLLDRLLVGHSVRPVGAGGFLESGRRITRKTAQRRQPQNASQTELEEPTKQ